MKEFVHCVAAVLAHAAFAVPAQAQIAVEGTLPNVTFTDANGVDLRSGQLLKASGRISIGPADAPILSYQLFDTFRDATNPAPPLSVRLRMSQCSNGVSSPASGCFQVVTAEVGAVGHDFGWEGGYPRTSRSGAKLEQTGTGYLLTDQDAIKYYMDPVSYVPGQGPVATIARVREIVRPNGERLTYTYDSLQAITSNSGYQLRYEGSGNNRSLKLINLAVDYCDPAAATCATTRNWPKFSFSQTVSGTLVDTAVDQSNRTYSVTQSSSGISVTSPGGGYNYSYKRSSFGQNPVGNTGAAQNIIATEWYEDADGRTTYSYTVDKFARVNASSATRPNGAVQRFAIERDSPYYEGQLAPSAYRFALTDAINRTTRVDVKKYRPNVDGYWPQEFDTSNITYPEGNSVAISREPIRNRLTTVTGTPKPGNNGTLSSTASYTDCDDWSLCAKPDYTIDARGNRADYTYDPTTGLVLTKTAPADANGVRPRTRYAYRQIQAVYKNAAGQLVPSGSPIWKIDYTTTCKTATECAGGADETRVTYGYDGNLLPTTETTSAGDGSLSSTVTKTYDAVGNLISVDGPLPGAADTTRYFYDDGRQLKGEIGPDPDGSGPLPNLATRYTYDGDGLVTLVEKGTASGQADTALAQMSVSEQVATAYGNGRKVKESRSSGNTTYAVNQFSYDSDGRLLCTAVRMNTAAYGSLPADACAPGTAGDQGPDRITKNVYDAAGQLLQVRKAVGTSIEQAYATYAYSANGKRSDVIDANGNRAQLGYDGYDRQSRWSFPSTARSSGYNPSTQANALATAGAVSASDYEAYGYDENDNRTSLRKRDGRTLTFTYDALNRMTSKAIPDGCAPTQVGACPATSATRDVFYGYDLRGLQTRARFDGSNGDGVTNDYDALGRLKTSTTAMAGYSRTLAYRYDVAGNRTRITHPDGVFFTTGYDTLSRMNYANWNDATQFMSITYDAQGRRGDINRASSYTGYSYDGVSRLTGMTQRFAGNSGNLTATFGYNPASQIKERTRDNADFAYTGYAATDRSYAANGLNQYSSVGANTYQYDANGNLVSDGGVAYGYDAENRLVSGPNGVTLSYDPLGRLWQTAGGAPGTTQFLYDGDALVAEYNGSGGLLRRYMHGPGVDEPILWDEGSALNCSGTKFLHTDHQGSVIAVADCNGNRTAVYAYDDYGVPKATYPGRFQYTGQAFIPELGMYYYKARMYSPMLGRFLQTDPIGYDDQINLYAYVANDPVNGRDPSGKFTCVNNGNGTQTCTAIGPVDTALLLVYAAYVHAQAAINNAMSGNKDKAQPAPQSSPQASSASPPPEDPNSREKAKDRRARQQREEQDRRAERTGGQSDTGGAPRSAEAQNSQFSDLAKQHDLTMDEANRLHQEITGQNLSRSEIAERIREMFGK